MPTGIGGEIAWWCPSLDDSGNGTTTLTDFIAAQNGTLTNFALSGGASNWIADTNFGGVRCLDGDGANDYVTCGIGVGNAIGTTSRIEVSLWFRAADVGFADNGLFNIGSFSGAYGKVWARVGPASEIVCGLNDTACVGRFAFSDVSSWHHFRMTYDGASLKTYLDGALKTTTAYTAAINCTGQTTILLGYFDSELTLKGRLDDVRIMTTEVSAGNWVELLSKRGYQPAPYSDDAGMFGGMSGAMTGGMAS